MAELAATHLIQAGIRTVQVTNRTYERAKELATQFRGEAIPFAQRIERLADVDIVISSTESPETIIRTRDIRDVLKRRKYNPMFFIDIAVPRDIDPGVNNLDSVSLYDIDDLKEVVEENLAHRREEAAKTERRPMGRSQEDFVMRAYLADELDPATGTHIGEQLTEMGFASDIEKLYWLPLEDDMPTPVQREHAESCGQHCMALELLDSGVRLELLVRAKGIMRCGCVSYTTPEAERRMVEQHDQLIAEIQKEEQEQLFGTCCARCVRATSRI